MSDKDVRTGSSNNLPTVPKEASKPVASVSPSPVITQNASGTTNIAPAMVEVPSPRERVIESFSQLFVFKNSGPLSVLIFAFSLASFGWLADSLLPLLQDLVPALIANATGQPTIWNTAGLLRVIVPAVIFLLVLAFLVYNNWRNTRPIDYNSEVPDTHKGLIVMLSKYSKRYNQEAYDSPDEIATALAAGYLKINKVLEGCNWGQLAFAVGYHSPKLERCWVLATKTGSAQHFEHAEKLIKHLVRARVGREVVCVKVELGDENDIGETAGAVSRIYNELSKEGSPLRASDVIADFTGGTAAMSGGLILATLQDGEEIEYIKQGINLEEGKMDARYVVAEEIIVSPRTSLRMAVRLSRRA